MLHPEIAATTDTLAIDARLIRTQPVSLVGLASKYAPTLRPTESTYIMIYATAVTLPDGSQLSYVERGERHDVDDPIVKLAPEMFRHVDGRPLAA